MEFLPIIYLFLIRQSNHDTLGFLCIAYLGAMRIGLRLSLFLSLWDQYIDDRLFSGHRRGTDERKVSLSIPINHPLVRNECIETWGNEVVPKFLSSFALGSWYKIWSRLLICMIRTLSTKFYAYCERNHRDWYWMRFLFKSKFNPRIKTSEDFWHHFIP